MMYRHDAVNHFGGELLLEPERVRSHFPALQSGAIFFDNPGGTQVTQETLQRMRHYLRYTNANHGGAFRTSRESDAVVDEARSALADFVNARRPEEIVFGPNMTTLTLHVSRSIARTLDAGDELIVTRMDHDANIRPWTLIAEDRSCTIRWVDFDPEAGTLQMDDLEDKLSPRTKVVAIGYASNALGTINDVQRVAALAHDAGALCYVDAVQYAPHGPIDVQALDCDFLVCSAYKFFGPHLGVLYGRYELLDQLDAYKVRPASDKPPGKFETGTQSFEAIAGTLGVLEYFQWMGDVFGNEADAPAGASVRRRNLVTGMSAIRDYEYELGEALIEGLQSVPGVRVWGLTDTDRLDERVPTISFSVEDWTPREIAAALAEDDIYVWDGNFYALAVTERLGIEDDGGMVRVGAVHYNTTEEVAQLIQALQRLVA